MSHEQSPKDQPEAAMQPSRHGGEASNLTETWTKVGELAHIGWQASLKGEPGQGFEPIWENDDDSERKIDIANALYEELPSWQKRICRGSAMMLSQLMVDLVCGQRPVDEAFMRRGSELVYRGWLHGRYGSPTGRYMSDAPPEKQADYRTVIDRYDRYDELVVPEVQEIDRNIVRVGLLPVSRPDLFPWIRDEFANIRNLDDRSVFDFEGVEEVERTGLELVRRVVAVTGRMSTLQAALLEPASS